MKAALEALLDDGYTIEEAAAELGMPEQEARRALIGPLEARQRPRADENGHGGPDTAGTPPSAGGAHTRPQRPRSKDFRRKPRTEGELERERRRAEQRILALPRGRRVELLAEAMAEMRGEELPSTHAPDGRRKAYFTLAEFALRALEMLLGDQRDPSPMAKRGEREL